MERETLGFIELLPYFAIALAGAIAHIFAKLSKLEEKRRFKISVWWKKNKFSTFLSLILSLAGVLTLDASGSLTWAAVFFMAYAIDSGTKNGRSAIGKS